MWSRIKGSPGSPTIGTGVFWSASFLPRRVAAESRAPRLNYTKPVPSDVIAPEIDQVFLIGDGTDYRYNVPPTATRLFLGFVDGRLMARQSELVRQQQREAQIFRRRNGGLTGATSEFGRRLVARASLLVPRRIQSDSAGEVG